MGKRGPRPTPSSVLKARGSKLASRGTAEPKPPPGRPARPDWLDEGAVKKWEELCPELEKLGLLTSIDGEALAVFCQACEELKIATQTIQKEGRVFRTPSGYIQAHPAVAMQRQAMQLIRSFAALYGLSPADRGRMQVEPPADPAEAERKQKLARFFSKPAPQQ